MKEERGFCKKGQVTIFIIIALVIVAGVIVYFLLLNNSPKNKIPVELRPPYDHYISCIQDLATEGITLMSEKGGYIENPDFVPGSAFRPFSSELNFFGEGVPYWMYVSGNNIVREQVPTKTEMQNQLNEYISERLTECDFSDYELEGFDVYVKEGDVETKINDLKVTVQVDNPIAIYYGNKSVSVSNHELSVESKLGKFYKMATDIYNHEKSNVFLEKYALDVMRLYAPVTGVEITCVPKIFVDSEIQEDIVEGLEANIATLKVDGDYYELSSKERSYFVEDMGEKIDENVNFFYSSDFPTRIEIYGNKVANPVGIQEGMGILGFCYVPYQLIYDINFPVLVQIYDENEIFQFPVAVIISKNQARDAFSATYNFSIEDTVCKEKNQEVTVYTYDPDLNPVEANIQFECLNSICDIGKTKMSGEDAVLVEKFPQCVNGFAIAKAEGYADAEYMISTNEESAANIVLRKKYNLSLDLGNVKKALVTFESEDYSTTVLYPDFNNIELIEAYYNITVYAYDNSTLKIPAMNDRKCVEVPESGISGFLGGEKEKCFDINIPEMDVSFVVMGGGKSSEYLIESELRESKEINLNVPLFKKPTTLEELQLNQLAVEDERIYMELE